MKLDRDATKAWAETVKNLAEILALFLAACWVVYTFILKEFPALEPRAAASSQLYWDRFDATGECEATFQVDIENNGSASFEIAKVQIRGWSFDRAKQPDDLATYLDLTEVQSKGKPFFDKIYSASTTARDANQSSPFLKHYSPGERFGHSFQWIISRDPGKWVFFRVDFYLKEDGKQPEWYTSKWSRNCPAE